MDKNVKDTEDLSFRQDELPADKSLVIVDDDKAFLQRFGRAMEQRGFEVRMGSSIAEGLDLIRQKAPAFAVVDMRLEDGNGLDVVAELSKIRPGARIIVLTGYGNFATAVSAVKLGAVDYLAKPADADEVTDALLARVKTQVVDTLLLSLESILWWIANVFSIYCDMLLCVFMVWLISNRIVIL